MKKRLGRYILEVDLEHPDELHQLHNDYLLASENREINHDVLSRYCSNIANYICVKISVVNELVAPLGNKSKYVLYCKHLQL